MRLSLLRWLLVPLVVLPVGWLLFTGLGHDPRLIPSPLVGKPMPAFAGTTLDGGHFSSADLAGKPAIVNFWASYCIPSCVDEHPVLLDLAERHGGELQMVGVLVNDTTDGARGFLARYGQVSWPTILNADGGISIDYGVT
ncbi:MAG TPA: redoxin family protein, partial [Candidatus Limnocylindria bacterium]